MKQINIVINTVNDAFGEDDESAILEVNEILKDVVNSLASGYRPSKLRDVNGNVVGHIDYQEE